MSLKDQRGFTLMEVLASTGATAIVIAAATAFLVKFVGWYDELSAKIAINRHARETYDMLSLGGLASTNGNDGTKNLYGVRERNKKPGGSQRNNYALRYVSNGLTLTPDTVASMTVACISPNIPLPDCGGGNKTVTGWIGDNMTLDDGPGSVTGNTVEVTFIVMNPFQVQRAESPTLFAETYRAIFTYNREENDP